MNLPNVEQPESSSGSTDFSQEQFAATDAKQPTITDLDKLEKFMFDGKEWSPKDLKSAYMAHADYTRKTQALAQERKFMENLELDLDAVRANPSLAEEFKRVYPQAYHKYLKYAGGESKQAGTQSERSTGVEANPEILAIKSELQELRDFYSKAQMQEYETQFSNVFNSQLKQKYPLVDEDSLAGLAREAMQMGYRLRDENGKVNASVLDQIAKFENDRLEKKFQGHQKTLMEKQRAASKQARDIGSGGGIPGQAPKRMSFKEATEAAIRDLEQRR